MGDIPPNKKGGFVKENPKVIEKRKKMKRRRKNDEEELRKILSEN